MRWGLELDLFGGRQGFWFSSVPPQDEDDGDEEEIRAPAETSDETQEDDPVEKRHKQREKELYVEHLGFGLQWSYLYLLDS